MNVFIRFLVIVCVVLLAACGFQLRGSGHSLGQDFDHMYIAGLPTESDFYLTLRARLQDQGILVTDQRETAEWILTVAEPVNSSRLVSVNKLAQGVDYSLFVRSKFSLVDAEGLTRVNNRPIEARRDIVTDPDDALGNDQLEKDTREQLKEALVDALFLQMRAQVR